MSTPEKKSPQQLQATEDAEALRFAFAGWENGLLPRAVDLKLIREAMPRLDRLQERAEATERAERELAEEVRGSDASHKALDAFNIERTSGSGESPPSARLNVTQRIQRLGERRAKLAQLLSGDSLQRVEEAPNPASPALQACVPERPEMGLAEFIRAVATSLGVRPLASMPHLEAIAEFVERGGQVSITGGRPYQRRALQAEVMSVLKSNPGPGPFTFKPRPPRSVRQALDGAYLVLDRVEDEEERRRWKPVLEMLEAAVGPARPPLSGKPADIIVLDEELPSPAIDTGPGPSSSVVSVHKVDAPLASMGFLGMDQEDVAHVDSLLAWASPVPAPPEKLVRLARPRVQALAEAVLPEATRDEVVALAREALALRAARRLLSWLGMTPVASILGPHDVVLHQVEEHRGPFSFALVRWLAVEVLEDRCHQEALEEQLGTLDRGEVDAVAQLLLEALRVGMTGRHLLRQTTLATWGKLEPQLQGALRITAGVILLRSLSGDLPLSMPAARPGASHAR